jgi:hypothetical protein
VHHTPLKSLAAASILSAALALTAHAQVGVTINATKAIRVVDNRQFGINTPFWDGSFTDADTLSDLQQMGTTFMRFGGGSATDEYDWTSNSDIVGKQTWAFSIDGFAAQAQAIHAQAIITTNYGSGTPAMAAAYVQYANVTKGYGFKYWEIGNECYGTWEYDTHTLQHDPYTYGMAAAQYITAMRAVDPTIKIGVVADDSEDSYAVGYTSHPAKNLVTGVTHNGWTPVVLATMNAAGVLPDFLIYHRYEQNAGAENDSVLLQEALMWPQAATELRTILTDYLGTAGNGIELLCTENNSVSTSPGKQSVSLVNGLYLADSTANLMQTEINGLTWWDIHNGQGFNSTSAPINLSPSLYGWRMYGDYGVEYEQTGDHYPTFYIDKLLTHYARGGDTVVTASTNNLLLSAYAVKRVDGTLSVLVINKSPTATYTANFALTGFVPQANATVYSYGIPQDIAAENAAAPATGSGIFSSWENSLDGWVNQSGQPDLLSTNFGLEGPFLYATTFSTMAGVTDGSSSLACTTTAATPGDSAVIQNSTTTLGTAMSTAASVSFDVFPQVAAGTAVQASFYINGTNIPYVLLGPTTAVTLNANQENTVTFTLTDAQRAGIAASLGGSNYFQVGININSPAPLTVFFDKFTITSNAPAAPAAPVPGGASSPDVAVSSISNAGTTFSASFGPYSATVLSLSPPVVSPVSASQPTSQTVATGAAVVFSFPATGAPEPTFQWFLNGSAVPGGTSSTLVIDNSTAADAGTYTCVATNASGTATSNPATLAVVNTANPGRLINLSARAEVGTGGNIVFGGFAIGPSGTPGTQPVLIRASGPALAQFSVPGLLPDPQLQLFNSAGNAISGDLNDGWGGGATISAAAAAVGAFAWNTPTSHDAALDLSLASGTYTAQVVGQTGDTGDALMEVYDATPKGTYTPSMPRLINLSARVDVGAGPNALFAGFVIGGDTSLTVLIRASGPAIAAAPFDVPGTLTDPQLTLQNPATGAVIASNVTWGGDPVVTSTAASVGAFSWSVPSSHDAALLITLPPGSYTAECSGSSGDSGVAIVEVYEVQ